MPTGRLPTGPALATPASATPDSASPVAASAAQSAGQGTTIDKGASAAASALPAPNVSVVPGIARYHTADCILIRFLSTDDLETMTQQAAEKSGCVPCRACRPEKAGATA